jgi:hypothetical protein
MTGSGPSRLRRREVFAAALAGGLAVPAAARAQDDDDPILRRLIAREDAAAIAYKGVSLPGIGDASAQDKDHAQALRVQLQALITPRQPWVTADELDPAARRLNEAVGEERHVAAVALETELIAAYRDALLVIVEPAILKTAATILACHAQRRALLTAASYPP